MLDNITDLNAFLSLAKCRNDSASIYISLKCDFPEWFICTWSIANCSLWSPPNYRVQTDSSQWQVQFFFKTIISRTKRIDWICVFPAQLKWCSHIGHGAQHFRHWLNNETLIARTFLIHKLTCFWMAPNRIRMWWNWCAIRLTKTYVQSTIGENNRKKNIVCWFEFELLWSGQLIWSRIGESHVHGVTIRNVDKRTSIYMWPARPKQWGGHAQHQHTKNGAYL